MGGQKCLYTDFLLRIQILCTLFFYTQWICFSLPKCSLIFVYNNVDSQRKTGVRGSALVEEAGVEMRILVQFQINRINNQNDLAQIDFKFSSLNMSLFLFFLFSTNIFFSEKNPNTKINFLEPKRSKCCQSVCLCICIKLQKSFKESLGEPQGFLRVGFGAKVLVVLVRLQCLFVIMSNCC